MDKLFSLLPFLNGYPTWLRAAVLAMPPLYGLAVVLLYVFAPTPVVAIETLRRFATLGKKDFVALDVTVRNPTAAIATVTTAQLELYAGVKPEGGLLSATAVSATYSVETTEQGVIVQSDQDKLPFAVTVTKPYTGNSYERMTLPLSQQIDAGKVDRFILLLRSVGIGFPAHDTVSLQLTYNGDQRSAPLTLSLK